MARYGMYRFDPITGVGSFETSDGTVIGGTLRELSSDRFTVSNGRFIDLQETNAEGQRVFNPLTIGQQGDATLEILENGRFSLISQTHKGLANRQLGNESLRMVGGPVRYLDSTGAVQEFDIGPIPINNIDHTWVAYLQEDGEWGYANIAGSYRTTGEVQAVYGPSYRLATPEEASLQAIAKSLYQRNFDSLRELAIQEGVLDSNGNPDVSGMVRQILETPDFTDLRFYRRDVIE